MGCDIHVCVEIREERYKNQEPTGEYIWRSAEVYVRDRHATFGMCKSAAYYGRNYELFTALAGVRGDDDSPRIDDPRGLPHDVSEQTEEEHRAWDCDAHSASHVTLAELYAFQEAHKTVKRKGMLSIAQAKALDEDGVKPSTWCQWTSEDTWVHREWEDEFKAMDTLIQSLEMHLSTHFRMWNPKDRAEDVRIVFWFDN